MSSISVFALNTSIFLVVCQSDRLSHFERNYTTAVIVFEDLLMNRYADLLGS